MAYSSPGAGPVRPRVVLLLTGIADLRSGGGAERFAASFLTTYRGWAQRRFDVELVTDAASARRLRDSGCLQGDDGLRLLPPADGLGVLSARASVLARALEHADLVHIPLISPRYLGYLWARTVLARETPRVCISVVDSRLARTYFDRTAREDSEQRRSALLHRIYFRSVRVDGVFTWYRAWAAAAPRVRALGAPLVHPAACYFVDTGRFRPASVKERVIAYVGRFVAVKRPLLFIQAIEQVRRAAPSLLDGWRVVMYGDGPLGPQVRLAVSRAGLDDIVKLDAQADLAPALARSRLYVSTQAHENFSSMALLEAMACGNAVVAQDVGQTREVVEHRGNGLLVEGGSPAAFAEGICAYLQQPEQHQRYAQRSREITLTRHTAERFFRDLESFWEAVRTRGR